MSYILDALKKAESERERGAVPGLGSTQTSYSTYIRYGGSYRPWWLALLSLGVLVALVLGTWAWRQPATEAPQAPSAQSAPVAPAAAVPAAVVPAVAPVAAPLPPGPQVASATAAAPAPAPQPVVAQAVVPKVSAPVASSTVVSVVAKVSAPPAAPVPSPAVAAVPSEPVAKAEPVPAPKALPSSASPVRAASGGIPLLGELPEPTRRQIPALAISGAIYSDSPPEWTLIINDQVMGKGSQVTPELRLEDISASSAVFNFRGQRFRVDR